MSTIDRANAQRQERALLKLAAAQRGHEAAQGSPASIRQMALARLRRAELEAEACGVLTDEAEIMAERRDFAHARLLRAQQQLLEHNTPENGEAFLDAVAIGKEFGVIA